MNRFAMVPSSVTSRRRTSRSLRVIPIRRVVVRREAVHLKHAFTMTAESAASNCDGVDYVNVGAPTRTRAEITYTSIKKPVLVPSGNNSSINTSGYASGGVY